MANLDACSHVHLARVWVWRWSETRDNESSLARPLFAVAASAISIQYISQLIVQLLMASQWLRNFFILLIRRLVVGTALCDTAAFGLLFYSRARCSHRIRQLGWSCRFLLYCLDYLMTHALPSIGKCRALSQSNDVSLYTQTAGDAKNTKKLIK